MRKLLMVIAFLLPFGVAQAQDKAAQAPIIALFENKLYNVSAEDGSAKILAEMPAGETFFANHGLDRLSPDGKYMFYATANDPESPAFKVTPYLLDVASGQSEEFQPRGGVFDRPPTKGYHFRVDSPTWSLDGSRLYYARSAADDVGYGKFSEIQLAYFDMARGTHKLVARLDPKQQVQQLMAVRDGIVVHFVTTLGADQPVAYYAANNQLVKENAVANLYPYTVGYEGQEFYATGERYGGIETLVNVETGGPIALENGYYPAARSLLAGDQSLHIYRFIGQTGTWYSVYGADYQHYLGNIDEANGVHFAFVPDGQSLAYLQMDQRQKSAIHIMTVDGSVRELPFTANEIYWGASEYIAFYAPG